MKRFRLTILIFIITLILPAYIYAQEKLRMDIHVDSIFIDSFIVNINHPDSTLNSKYADFGAVQVKDNELYFSSIRPDADEKTETFIAVNYLSKIYQSTAENGKWIETKPFLSSVNKRGSENADICFSPTMKRFYFTRAEAGNEASRITSIYVCEKKNDKWQKPHKIEGKVNLKDFSSTQPAAGLSVNGNDVLYFVSERLGGIGKKDIWYSELMPNGQYTEPVNAGPDINTTDNEISPFYYQRSATLYYSSDKKNGLGGFDIYKSRGAGNSWDTSVNIGKPLNSRYDDLYYTANTKDSTGFFTSNRPGSLFHANDSCCYDIYEYKVSKVKKFLKLLIRRDTTLKDTFYIGTDLSNLISKDSLGRLREKELSLNKEQEKDITIKNLKALNLYFDNDYPTPRSSNVFTDDNYNLLLKNYINKRNEYIKMFADDLPSPLKDSAEKQINAFFFQSIAPAEEELKKFSETILSLLKNRCKITLEIGGYCSPLFTSPYNYNLSQRRISSFIVYLCHYRNGELIKYFHPADEKSGKLSFILTPEGKEKAPKNVSENPKDRRNSVYSPSASKERKLVINAIVEKYNY